MQNRPAKTSAYAARTNELTYLLGFSLVACAVYAWVWSDFLTSSMLFGDYGLSIPTLLDYFFWAHRNGLAIQWFTPGFCGGIPVFPEPQSAQYSILTLLTYWAGPTLGVKTAFIAHAWIGFVGGYLLCRRSYRLRVDTSLVAATLFMFNGFYAYRIVVSHLFFGLMLTPVLAWLLLEACARRKWWGTVESAMAASLVFVLYIYSGGLGMVIPFCAGVTVLMALQFAMRGGVPSFKSAAIAAVVFITIAYALCSPKLVAASSFLGQFPRDSYRLPGFSSVLSLLKAMWMILFFSPGDTGAAVFSDMKNVQWLLERHEWEFGVSLVPVILLLVPLKNAASFAWHARQVRWFYWSIVAGLLLLPMALNYYTPEWNHWLKQIPVLKSSSNLVRYFWIWVVFLCFFPVIFFDRYNGLSSSWRFPTVGLCLALVIFTFASQDKDYYRRGSTYDPASVEHAYRQVERGQAVPRIESLGVLTDDQGKILAPPDRNKTLANGMSQLLCYQPIFGYRLEKFPFGSIHPGDPLEESAPGRLNFKNPACMVYPEANACSLGDEFHLDQKDELVRLLRYEPYAFSLSNQQLRADSVAIAMFILILAYLGVKLMLGLSRRKAARSVNH